MNDSNRVSLRLEQQQNYRCTLHFEEGVLTLTVDEPPPMMNIQALPLQIGLPPDSIFF